MITVLVHAKGCAAADDVARAMPGLAARIVLGDAPPQLTLGALTAVLVWNAETAAKAESLPALLGGAGRLVVVSTDDTPWRGPHPAAHVDWRAGPHTLAAAIADAPASTRRPRRLGLSQIAAGVMAMIGLIAPAQTALAAPADSVAAQDFVAAPRPAAQIAAQAEAPTALESAEAGPAWIDFDALGPHGADSAAAAALLVSEGQSRAFAAPAIVAPTRALLLPLLGI